MLSSSNKSINLFDGGNQDGHIWTGCSGDRRDRSPQLCRPAEAVAGLQALGGAGRNGPHVYFHDMSLEEFCCAYPEMVERMEDGILRLRTAMRSHSIKCRIIPVPVGEQNNSQLR